MSVLEVPNDALQHAFSFLHEEELAIVEQTCKRLASLITRRTHRLPVSMVLISPERLKWAQTCGLRCFHLCETGRKMCKRGDLPGLRNLLSGIDFYYYYMLMDIAVEFGHIHIVKALLSGELGPKQYLTHGLCEIAAKHRQLKMLYALRDGSLGDKAPGNRDECYQHGDYCIKLRMV